MPTLALIGFGQFGQLVAQHLTPHFTVLAYDAVPNTAAATRLGVTLTSLETAAKADVVVLAVPTQSLRETLMAIAPHVQPKAWVMDVCSVKVLPATWLEELLPPHVNSAATHPLFGPQSGANGIAGLGIAVCPVRGDVAPVCAFLQEKLGLKVILTTAAEHDQHMAYVQGMAHLIGHALQSMDLPATPMATKSYNALLELKHLLQHDTPELFQAIQTLNPHAAPVAQQLLGNMQALLAKNPQTPHSDT
ncbi:MAG: prephenate dehydrogenase/arogenate dehydrogenase family protein [Alphaproteobacteria bacterium]